MKVAVVGAGPCGLTTIKQLRDEGHEVVCFEKNASIGGIWFRHDGDDEQTKAFDSLILTVSMKLMSFSDFMAEGPRAYATHETYLAYLRAYADRFGLLTHIAFDSSVEEIRKLGEEWRLTVVSKGKRTEHTFGAVALCSGPFKTPNTKVEHIENFPGEVVHSAHYRNNERFCGKRVLIVGLAESGADIVREISNVSSECTLSIRSRSFLLPRLYSGTYTTDSYSARAVHYEGWVRSTGVPNPMKSIFGDGPLSKSTFMTATRTYGLASLAAHLVSGRAQDVPARSTNGLFHMNGHAGNGHSDDLDPKNGLGQPQSPSKLDLFCEENQENFDFINDWNRRSHEQLGNYTPKVIFCKNVSFVPNIRNGKVVVNDSGIAGIEGNIVHFKDGSSKEFDSIVLCTGYVHDFSILPNVEIADNNVRNLYKHAIHPDHAGKLALIGFVRPYTGGIPMCAEMQARYFAMLLSGKVKLPEDVRQRIRDEKAWEESFTVFSPRQFEAIPSIILFCDSIAREIGCLPAMSELIRKPKLLMRLWFYTFNHMCYRLTGAHHMYESAINEIMAEQLPGKSTKGIVYCSLMSLLPHSVHPKNGKVPPF